MRERLRIYIAGPITQGDLSHNIMQAEAAFYALLYAGFAPFCPHWSCYGGGPKHTVFGTVYAFAERLPSGTVHDDWIGVDTAWVVVADAVLRLPGESRGADAETAAARSAGVPVFDSIEDLITWSWSQEASDQSHCEYGEPVG